MKKICFLILIANFAFSQTATLSIDTILIGKQVKFSITNPIEESKIWPSYDNFLTEGLEIIETSNIDTNKGIISQDFIITSWEAGNYKITSIAFSKKNKNQFGDT